MIIRRICLAVLATFALSNTTSAFALDVPVSAKKLVVIDKLAASGKAKTVFVAKDPAIDKGAGSDAALISTETTFAFSDLTGAAFSAAPTGSFDGTSGWRKNSSDIASFTNKIAPAGPTQAKTVLVKQGALIKVSTKGIGDIPLHILSKVPAETVDVLSQVCVDNAGETNCHCSSFVGCRVKEISGGTGAKLTCKNGVPDPSCGGANACVGIDVASIGEIQALGSGATARITSAILVATTVALPAGVDLCFAPGGFLDVAPGVTLSAQGNVDAGDHQIFAYTDDTSKVVAPLQTEIRAAWWGATIDDATNDTAALRYAGRFLSDIDGGTLQLQTGTYIVGSQQQTGTVPNFKLTADDIIYVENAANPVVIEGNDAVLRAADGMIYGYYDPATGNPTTPPVIPPATEPACGASQEYAANAYWGMIDLYKNADVTIRNLELDGNSANYVLGGDCGSEGRQLASNGIRSYEDTTVSIDNVHTHHHGADGLLIHHPMLTEVSNPTPFFIDRVVSEFNGRQGLSWVGGIGLTVTNSEFSHTGRAGISSPPGAGVDIEVEDMSVIRNGLFEDCIFEDNSGPGIVADEPNVAQGDVKGVTVRRSTLHGTTTWSTIMRVPEVAFEDCTFYGAIPNSYSADGPGEGPAQGLQFIDSHFEDPPGLPGGVYRGNNILLELNGHHTLIDGCTVVAHESTAMFLDGGTTTETVRDTEVTHGWDARPPGEFQSVFRGSILENVTFHEDIVTAPATNWYIADETLSTTNVCLDGPYVRWGGTAGPVGCLP